MKLFISEKVFVMTGSKDKVQEMFVVLQKRDVPLRCYQHNIIFKNEIVYNEHMETCRKLCSVPNVCNYSWYGGTMCGKNYNTTSALIFHFLNEHFKYLCSNCDQYFDDVYDLEHHEHTHENVHDSEYKREKRKKFFCF